VGQEVREVQPDPEVLSDLEGQEGLEDPWTRGRGYRAHPFRVGLEARAGLEARQVREDQGFRPALEAQH
jgi:hypothetical protein